MFLVSLEPSIMYDKQCSLFERTRYLVLNRTKIK